MNNKLKVLDLFSGIGGFSLGLHSTGIFETIKFVEFDKYCQKVLQKNFTNIPIEEDIKNVKGKEFEADVITGGFPCQPFSVAGKQKGTNDNRYLWPEMFRLIKEIKPEFVIGENVQGIINLQDGMVLRQVLNDLESEGFEVQCFLIPASGIGAWHQRNRTWIIGHSKTNGLLKAENVSNTERNQHKHPTIGKSRTNKIWGFYSEKKKQTTHDLWSKTSGCNALSREGKEDVSDSTIKGLEGCSLQSNNQQTESAAINSNTSIEEQQTWWQVESAVRGIPNGISYELDKDRANRIKTLGNAIVPQIAREFGLAIKKVLSDSNRNG